MDSPSKTAPAEPCPAPQLTLRAVVTGMGIGAILCPCNIYTGLKIGWSFNMSIAAALLGLAFWKTTGRIAGTRPLGLLENNINQTCASSAASILSAGLVAPIPALTLMTGRTLAWPALTFWVFTVSLLGVVVAVGLRRQMIEQENLPFPAGMATAETVREIYSHGAEAASRVRMLLGGGTVAAALKGFQDWIRPLPRPGLPGSLSTGAGSVSLKQLGFTLDPSLMMVGFGMLMGPRIGCSLLAGALLAWGWLGPLAVSQGWANGGAPQDASWFGPLVEWLLWPGVTLMVISSLTSFALSVRRLKRRGAGARSDPSAEDASPVVAKKTFQRGFIAAVAVATLLATFAQAILFGIHWWVGLFAVAFSVVMAVVAGRVTGETAITPIGAMGKVTQLTFGVVSPQDATTNLMAANVTGGAAGQCADLLHDLKSGRELGADPRLQAIAQVFGVLTGSLAGAAAYLILVPDPAGMLLTREWPAPAVATWKAVAEVFQSGWGALPTAAVPAMAWAAIAGFLLAILEERVPAKIRRAWPSASALGLAFVIPAGTCVAFFLGGMAHLAIHRWRPDWARRYLTALAAGLVAGESLAGVTGALGGFLKGD